MNKRFCLLAAACLLCFLLAGCSAESQSGVTPEYVLTYADNQPADYPTTKGAMRFAELVKERTEGRVVIQVKSGSILSNKVNEHPIPVEQIEW